MPLRLVITWICIVSWAAAAQIVPDQPYSVTARWLPDEPGRPMRVLLVAPESALGDGIALERASDAEVNRIAFDRFEPSHQKADPDVVIVGNPGRALPLSVETFLTDHIRQGGGVVWFRYAESPMSWDALMDTLEPVAPPQTILRGAVMPDARVPSVRLLRMGQARIAEVDFDDPAPEMHCMVPPPGDELLAPWVEYANAMAVAVRAVRWAAERESSTRIAGVTVVEEPGPDPALIPPRLDPGDALDARPKDDVVLTRFQVDFKRPLDPGYALEAQIRYPDRNHRWSYLMQSELGRGVRRTKLELPVGAGAYYLDLWLHRSGRRVDWYTIAGRNEIGIALAPAASLPVRVRRDDSIRLQVRTADPNAVWGERSLWAVARDSIGRTAAIGRTLPSPTSQSATIDLDITGLVAPGVRFEIRLEDGTDAYSQPWLAQQHGNLVHWARVDALPSSAFELVADAELSTDWGSRWRYAGLRKSGVDSVIGDPKSRKAWAAIQSGLKVVPETRAATMPRLDMAAFDAPALRYHVWQVALEGRRGIVARSLPWHPESEDRPDSPWTIMTKTVELIRRASPILRNAPLTASSISGTVDTAAHPAELDVDKSRFSGDWYSYELEPLRVLAAAVNPDAKKQRLQVRIPDDRFGYLPLTGEALDPGERHTARPQSGEVVLLTTLPYAVSRVLLDPEGGFGRGSRTRIDFEIRTRVSLPVHHWIRLDLYREAEGLLHYSQTIKCPAGQGSAELTLAVDEPEGRYTLVATDLISGVSGNLEFELGPTRATPRAPGSI